MPNRAPIPSALRPGRPSSAGALRRVAFALLAVLAGLVTGPADTGAQQGTPSGAVRLQLGLFQGEGDAWWAWDRLRRKHPDLEKALTPEVAVLDPTRRGDGVVLRAALAPVADPHSLCRRLVGDGFGCLVLSTPPAGTASAAPPATRTVTLPQPSQHPIPQRRPVAPTPAPPPVSAPVSAATAAPEGPIAYNEEQARTLSVIERRTRLRGRLGAVLLDATVDVAPAVWRGVDDRNFCALTFDDGPHRVVTRRILDILTAEKVRATYFPIGDIAARHPDVVRDFVAAGHEIGNHSLTHADLRSVTPEVQRHEIAEANRILRSLGAEPTLFRPPYGRYTDGLLDVARQENTRPVLWNVDTRDWKMRDPDKIVDHVKLAAGSASVLLMHSTLTATAEALPRVVAELRAKDCAFVTLSEWIERMEMIAVSGVMNAAAAAPLPTRN